MQLDSVSCGHTLQQQLTELLLSLSSEAAKKSVREFAVKRVSTVAEGLEDVIEWMQGRGYAPKAAVAEPTGEGEEDATAQARKGGDENIHMACAAEAPSV